MTEGHSERIAGLFADSSRDVTPESARPAASVLYAPVFSDPEVTRLCESVLTIAELQRAQRFVSEHDKAHYKQRRAFRHFCGATALESSQPLQHILFEETEKGRPFFSSLPNLWFSFSSCRFGFLGAWSSTHGIGVDLEDQTRTLEAIELARRFFSKAEANAVKGAEGSERLAIFLQFWSLKEAALKSIGEGLPFGLDAFEFELAPNLRVVHAPSGHGGPKQFEGHLIQGADSNCAALVIRRFPDLIVST
jgi:phosphopantetheine--protein transferase-like protein